jgi:hypothetical protein
MAKQYYTMIVRTPDQLWSPEFGDYSRAVVAEEMADQKRNGGWPKKTKFKIIKTADDQKSITAAVEAMN